MQRRIVLLAVSAAVAALSGTVFGADSTDRTTMPDFCSNRDVNCVLPDGAQPRVVTGGGTPTTPVQTPTPPSAASGAPLGKTPVVVPPTTVPGVTTVLTPPVGTNGATGPSVPAVPALPGGIPTLSGGIPSLPGAVPSLPGGVPSLTTGGTSSGTTSSSTSTGTGTTGGTTGTGAAASGGAPAAVGGRR